MKIVCLSINFHGLNHHAKPEACFFWGVHSQAELDCLVVKDGKKLGFEFKYTDALTLTASMTYAMEQLKLDIFLDIFKVIYPGKKSYWLTESIEVVGLETYLKQ